MRKGFAKPVLAFNPINRVDVYFGVFLSKKSKSSRNAYV